MKKSDVKIGSTYTAKITNRVVPVRIDAANPNGGWDATNLATKKKVRIKSAAKLRGEHREHMKATAAADQENARLRDQRKASPDGQTASERAMNRSSKTTKSARTTKTAAKGTSTTSNRGKSPKSARRTNARKPKGDSATKRKGILDYAAEILANAKEPMSCKDIVEKAQAAGWTTSGKTPHATLYAAIIREISKKGKDARFEKVDRGRFRIRKGA